jgi:hypothetical protein
MPSADLGLVSFEAAGVFSTCAPTGGAQGVGGVERDALKADHHRDGDVVDDLVTRRRLTSAVAAACLMREGALQQLGELTGRFDVGLSLQCTGGRPLWRRTLHRLRRGDAWAAVQAADLLQRSEVVGPYTSVQALPQPAQLPS